MLSRLGTKIFFCRSMWSEHRFISFDKTPIFFRRLSVKNPSKGLVVIVHGMGEHSGRYREFAEFLGENGYCCYLPDLRGFGQSGGKRGCVKRFTDYFFDLDGVRRLMHTWESHNRAFYFGHSYGGLITTHYLLERPALQARGLILSSPNFGISVEVPFWRTALARVAAYLAPDMTQSNRVDRTKLTHDVEHLRKHAADRLIHDRISAGLYVQLLAGIEAVDKAAPQIKVPALVLQAGEDYIVDTRATQRVFNALGSPDKKFKEFEGMYHEILNETSRQAVYQLITAWLGQHT